MRVGEWSGVRKKEKEEKKEREKRAPKILFCECVKVTCLLHFAFCFSSNFPSLSFHPAVRPSPLPIADSIKKQNRTSPPSPLFLTVLFTRLLPSRLFYLGHTMGPMGHRGCYYYASHDNPLTASSISHASQWLVHPVPEINPD